MRARAIGGELPHQLAKLVQVEHQVAALLEGVGSAGAGEVRGICSDAPEVLDAPQTYAAFAELEVIIRDVLHVALRIEKASGE